MSARQSLANLISDEWAGIPALAGVRIVATERQIDDMNVPTLIVRMRTIERGAAQGIRDYTFVTFLVSKHDDLDAAADELDDLVPAMRDWLDTTGIRSGETRIVAANNRLAAETELTVLTSQESE